MKSPTDGEIILYTLRQEKRPMPESFPLNRFTSPERIWRLKTRSLSFRRSPRWMGIVNVTPDSFSDGGTLAERDRKRENGLSADTDETFRVDVEAACRRGLSLASDGAEILDIGGESTRPGSRPVSAEDQIARTVPVIERLSRLTSVPISIDTTSAKTATAALEAGAEIINDISGGTFDPEMVGTAARFRAGICLGHIRGNPQTMQDAPVYEDVVAETIDFLRDRRAAFLAAGLDAERIVLDPGIGFGKTTAHNLAILRNLPLFRKLGAPILIGHSRKRFLADLARNGHFGPNPAGEDVAENDRRDFWTASISVQLAQIGVDLLRVHNVRVNREAVEATAH